MKYLLLIIFSFPTLSIKAQAIIRDDDGYTNVRTRGEIGAPVSFRILENQVFALDDWGAGLKPKWLPISFFTEIDSTNCYIHYYKSGFIHESRVLMLKDIQKQYSPKINDTKATITADNLEAVMTIEANPEAPSKDICSFGTDQGYGTVHNRMESLTVKYQGEIIPIPKEDLEHLYSVHLSSFKVYQHNGSHFIYISTSAAAGYYFCVWHFKNGVYQKRYLYLLG